MTEYQKGRERGYELGKLTASDTIQALADTIEALRAEIDALCIVNARLTKEAMSDYHEGWEEGCAAMKEENARLREALKPFARIAEFYICDADKDKDRVEIDFVVGDLRAARKAMGETE